MEILFNDQIPISGVLHKRMQIQGKRFRKLLVHLLLSSIQASRKSGRLQNKKMRLFFIQTQGAVRSDGNEPTGVFSGNGNGRGSYKRRQIIRLEKN